MSGQRNRLKHGLYLLCRSTPGLAGGHQAVGDRLGQDGLHIVRRHVGASAQERLCLGGTDDRDACARAQTLQEPLTRACGCDQVLHVVEQRVRGVHLHHLALQLLQLVRRQKAGQGFHDLAPVLPGEQRAFCDAVRVTERNPHQETVELGFRQRVGAQLVVRVLCGDDEKWRGQRAGLALHGDLFFLHGLQQRALCLGAGTVDLVGQQNLGEDRPGVEHKSILAALEDRHARQVAGHQVGRELDPRKLQAEGARQRMGQRGLSDTRHVLDQQVATGQQTSHAILDLGWFPSDDRVKLIQQ